MTALVHRNSHRLATKLFFVPIHNLWKHRRFRRAIFVQYTVRDELLTSLRYKNQMSEFYRLVLLSLLDQFRVRLEQTEHFLLIGNLLAVESSPRNIDDLFHPRKVAGKLCRKGKCQLRTFGVQ